MSFAHLQSLTSSARDPRTNAPLNSIGARYKLMGARELEQAEEEFERARRRIHMQKTTLADKRRHLRQTGQRPPRRLNKLTYASAGGKTYDAGVVARAKENARNAQNFEMDPFQWAKS